MTKSWSWACLLQLLFNGENHISRRHVVYMLCSLLFGLCIKVCRTRDRSIWIQISASSYKHCSDVLAGEWASDRAGSSAGKPFTVQEGLIRKLNLCIRVSVPTTDFLPCITAAALSWSYNVCQSFFFNSPVAFVLFLGLFRLWFCKAPWDNFIVWALYKLSKFI